MVGLRPGSCYRRIKRAYTRKSKFKSKGYIKSVPANKIVKYDFGDNKKLFPKKVNLVSTQPMQIRHNALESARVMVVRKLSELLGNNYRLQIRVFPHHVLRENKMLTGAGADRMSTGMQQSFGKPTGIAARVRNKQAIFTVYVDNDGVAKAKIALDYCSYKLPCKTGLVIEENKSKFVS